MISVNDFVLKTLQQKQAKNRENPVFVRTQT